MSFIVVMLRSDVWGKVASLSVLKRFIEDLGIIFQRLNRTTGLNSDTMKAMVRYLKGE